MKLNITLPLTLLGIGVSAHSQAAALSLDYGFTGLANYTGPSLVNATTIRLDTGIITQPFAFTPVPATGNLVIVGGGSSYAFTVATTPSQLVGVEFSTPLSNGDSIVFTTTGLESVSAFGNGASDQSSFFLTGTLTDTKGTYSSTPAVAVIGVTSSGRSVGYSANVSTVTPSPASVLPMAFGLVSLLIRKRRTHRLLVNGSTKI